MHNQPIQQSQNNKSVSHLTAPLRIFAFGVWLATIFLVGFPIQGQTLSADRRATEIRHLDLDYTNQLRTYTTREAWVARAEHLRQQILVSAGLWPTPAKQPLNPTLFGKVDRGTYTIEKVYFESFPGHFVTGNLYRPKNPTSKVPAVLCPHGHWNYGRLENTPLNSGPLRAASFANQGYVAFTWDMVGYNDSLALSHRFAIGHREGDAAEALWGINLLGLQLWNSIRSIDFLQSLPEVDPEKIGCTGESGGGTQTFLLAAIDQRIKVAAPVNMVSTLMQGGSLCENAPNLRIDTNNVEIAALMAPRPMLMVSATGDWTKNTLQVEYPAVRQIYQLFSAEDRLHAVQMNAPHNYNQDSREAVYGWFAHWFQGRAETSPLKERGVSVSPLTDLLVFYAQSRPANELNEDQFIAARIAAARQQLAEAQPTSAVSLAKFRQQFGVAYTQALQTEYPALQDLKVIPTRTTNGATQIVLSRQAAQDRVGLEVFPPIKAATPSTVMVITAPGNPAQEIVDALQRANHRVVRVNVFAAFTNQTELNRIKFFTTYNRTLAANRVQDILTALAYVQQGLIAQGEKLSVVGVGEAGLWTLLARGLAPALGRTVVDVQQFPIDSDAAFVQRLPIPGLRRAGDFGTAVTLAPLTPLLIHNTGQAFRTEKLADTYRQLGQAENFQARSASLSLTDLIAFLQSK